jgi:hypothetical protein
MTYLPLKYSPYFLWAPAGEASQTCFLLRGRGIFLLPPQGIILAVPMPLLGNYVPITIHTRQEQHLDKHLLLQRFPPEIDGFRDIYSKFIVTSVCGCTALVDLGRFFSFLLYTPSLGLLGWRISPSQGRYLHTRQHKHRINARDSNPRAQRSSRRRRFMP